MKMHCKLNVFAKIGIAILVLLVLMLLTAVIEYLLPDVMDYTVNSDQQTCTITGARNPDDIVLRIPKKIGKYTVTQIAPNAFSNGKMDFVVIPETVSKIGEKAFYECSELIWVIGLEKCTSLTTIEEQTFTYCESIRKITLPESIKTIGKCSFLGCYNLQEINIPSKVTSIEYGAFTTCIKIEQINIPASVKHIDPRAFEACYSLESLTVDEANLLWCSVDNVIYSKNMKKIHTYSAGKKESEFTIPEGVTTISSYAFANNIYLRTINIPSSVINIEDGIIYGANEKISKINGLNYDGTVEKWLAFLKAENWDNGSAYYTIYCTDGQITKYGTITYK